ncbi:rhodanese-like domain-containing protein [Brackiella oedipodis]|uniref:rhodanese-like domain-containing protein n=1 Tax=Brackiella oedipodis TaxID=124225 RepID=UPI0006873A30|nr:rhodanese-like domain-containing protein [Brackiella oedipodis]
MDFLTFDFTYIYIIGAVISGGLLLAQYRPKPDGVSPAEAVRLSNRQQAIFVDIRSAEDYSAGAIPQSRHIELQDINANNKNLPKKKPLIIVSNQERQAQKAVKAFKELGYEPVNWLIGGIFAWNKEELPLKKSATPVTKNAKSK